MLDRQLIKLNIKSWTCTTENFQQRGFVHSRIPLECPSPRCFPCRFLCAVWSSPPDLQRLPPDTDPPEPGSWRTRTWVWLRCCWLPLSPEKKRNGFVKISLAPLKPCLKLTVGLKLRRILFLFLILISLMSTLHVCLSMKISVCCFDWGVQHSGKMGN